jgi:hypothetical protein
MKREFLLHKRSRPFAKGWRLACGMTRRGIVHKAYGVKLEEVIGSIILLDLDCLMGNGDVG